MRVFVGVRSSGRGILGAVIGASGAVFVGKRSVPFGIFVAPDCLESVEAFVNENVYERKDFCEGADEDTVRGKRLGNIESFGKDALLKFYKGFGKIECVCKQPTHNLGYQF